MRIGSLVIGVLLSAGWLTFSVSVAADPVLYYEREGERFVVMGLDDGRPVVEINGRTVPAPGGGDLRLEFSSLETLWENSCVPLEYRIRRVEVPEYNSTDAPSFYVSYWGSPTTIRRTYRVEGWVDDDPLRGVLVFAWIIEGTVRHVRMGVLTDHEGTQITPAFHVDLSEEETSGFPVLLFLKEGTLLPPNDPGRLSPAGRLLSAAEVGDLAALKERIRDFRRPHRVTNAVGDNVLHLAVRNGHVAMADYLIANERGLERTNDQGDTPVHLVAELGRTEAMEMLLRAGARTRVFNSFGGHPLHLASMSGHLAATRLLLEAGADVSVGTGAGRGGLHPISYAMWHQHGELAKLLIENGGRYPFQRNAVDHYLFSVLGRPHLVDIALQTGANPSADIGGFLPLLAASRMDAPKTVGLLIDAGADVDAAGEDGVTALMHAAFNGHERVVRVLLEAGSEVNAVDRLERTALHFAVASGNTEAVRVLLEHGADPNRMNRDGWTPFMAAVRLGEADMVHPIGKAGAHWPDGGSGTVELLEYAIRYDFSDVVRDAMDRGLFDSNHRFSGRWPASFVAERYGARRTLEVLAEKGVESVAAGSLGIEIAVDRQPVPVEIIRPDYAYTIHDEYGDVIDFTVEFVLDQEGMVRFPRVEGVGPELLRNEIALAAESWRFRPAEKSGRPVAGLFSVPVRLEKPDGLLNDNDTGFTISGDSSALREVPIPVERPQPVYPDRLWGDGLEGMVLLRFVVDVRGEVQNIQVVMSSHPAFAEEAVMAVRRWRFTPGVVAGTPVATRMEVPIHFSLGRR